MSHESDKETVVENAMRWNLEPIFPGGSSSKAYKRFRDELRSDLAAVAKSFNDLPKELNSSTEEDYRKFIFDLQRMASHVECTYSMAECLIAQDVEDTAALQIFQQVDVMVSEFRNLETRFEALAGQQDDAEWDALFADEELAKIKFYLDELRSNARHKMPEEHESLANDLAVNGFHAWNRLYDKMAGDLKVDFEEDGKTSTISLGQLASKMDSSDRSIRRQAFEKLETAWGTRADYASMILNSLGGFRLTLYKHRKWDSQLYEPLMKGRLKRETLDAMWRAVSNGVPRLMPYVEAKKKLARIDRFMWYDQTAPIDGSDHAVSFAHAREFIVKHLGGFSDEMAQFSDTVFENNWIEAENRSGKAAGGFCTGFGHINESRIFMTYLDTFGDLMTLAHELGHAYHQHVLGDAPFFARVYPMNLAETASIFNELLVTDAAFSQASDDKEKLVLLDQKLQRAHVLFCNIHARFIFDMNFYDERKNGVVSRQRLDELMVQAQREAFGDTLDPDGCHPLFWASKLHFFLSAIPFYNFPYTFGYLFAGGVYDRAKKEGTAFAPKYRNLLRDTGSMTTEELGLKHFGVDLTKDEFWEAAVDRMLEDVDQFVELAR